MGLTEDLNAKRPGEWTDDDVKGLQKKYSRTHFTHFKSAGRKLKRLQDGTRRKINGVVYVWKNGRWTNT